MKARALGNGCQEPGRPPKLQSKLLAKLSEARPLLACTRWQASRMPPSPITPSTAAAATEKHWAPSCGPPHLLHPKPAHPAPAPASCCCRRCRHRHSARDCRHVALKPAARRSSAPSCLLAAAFTPRPGAACATRRQNKALLRPPAAFTPRPATAFAAGRQNKALPRPPHRLHSSARDCRRAASSMRRSSSESPRRARSRCACCAASSAVARMVTGGGVCSGEGQSLRGSTALEALGQGNRQQQFAACNRSCYTKILHPAALRTAQPGAAPAPPSPAQPSPAPPRPHRARACASLQRGGCRAAQSCPGPWEQCPCMHHNTILPSPTASLLGQLLAWPASPTTQSCARPLQNQPKQTPTHACLPAYSPHTTPPHTTHRAISRMRLARAASICSSVSSSYWVVRMLRIMPAAPAKEEGFHVAKSQYLLRSQLRVLGGAQVAHHACERYNEGYASMRVCTASALGAPSRAHKLRTMPACLQRNTGQD